MIYKNPYLLGIHPRSSSRPDILQKQNRYSRNLHGWVNYDLIWLSWWPKIEISKKWMDRKNGWIESFKNRSTSEVASSKKILTKKIWVGWSTLTALPPPSPSPTTYQNFFGDFLTQEVTNHIGHVTCPWMPRVTWRKTQFDPIFSIENPEVPIL